jgi:hypothetical protein
MWYSLGGLVLDIVGFLMVFNYGGFEKGRAALLLEEDTAHKYVTHRIVGAVMVVAGFMLQGIGTYLTNT